MRLLLLVAITMLSVSAVADDSFGSQFLTCLESKGIVMGKKSDELILRSAYHQCNESVFQEMQFLYLYGEAKVAWLKCVQQNKTTDRALAGLALGVCKKEYEILSKIEIALDAVGDGFNSANDVLKADQSLVISNPFPRPARMP